MSIIVPNYLPIILKYFKYFKKTKTKTKTKKNAVRSTASDIIRLHKLKNVS